MNLNLREHPNALEELRDAAIWYEGEQPWLGDDFIDAVEAALKQITEWPSSAPVFPGWTGSLLVRSMGVRVFPYRVHYYMTNSDIVILAYAHHRRQPNYWQQRTKNGP